MSVRRRPLALGLLALMGFAARVVLAEPPTLPADARKPVTSGAVRDAATLAAARNGATAATIREGTKPPEARRGATPVLAPPATPEAPFATSTSPCPPGNLVAAARVTAPGARTTHRRVQDGWLAVEGTDWQSPYALVLPERQSELLFDMGAPRNVKRIVLQGDNNDLYAIDGSLDGVAFHEIWVAPDVPDQGLRTRWVDLPKAQRVRHLRVRPRGGDSYFSVSEFRAYCRAPKPWPPKLNLPPTRPGLLGVWDWIDNDRMVSIKAIVAALGALVLLLVRLPLRRRVLALRLWRDGPLFLAGPSVLTWAWIERANLTRVQCWVAVGVGSGLVGAWLVVRWLGGPAESPRRFVTALAAAITQRVLLWLYVPAALGVSGMAGWKLGWPIGVALAIGLVLAWSLVRWLAGPVSFPRTAALVLAALGLFSFAAWWNLGHYHFNHYIHIWEHYHYYMGAKYGPELRYARLYECTAAADIADGLRGRVQKRKMRDLATTNELGTTDDILRDPKRCTDHFSRERWEAFRKDIRFFRGRFSRDRWDQSQTDHGYNGTPVWAITGRAIADFGTLTWEKIEAMALIDSVILGLVWLVVLWAFGWRATCVALLWWGTNFPARFYWNGGSFLRYDWLVWLVVGLCLLRKEKPFLGGVALTYATLLRVFPGFVVAAIVLKALARIVRERRFVLSRDHQRFALGCILALGVLIPASGWATGGVDAWGEFARNSEKHLATALTNNMGLKTALGFDWGTRAQVMRNDTIEDPFGDWKDAREYFYHKRGALLVGLIFMFCVMLARACDREPDWAAACLGTGLIVIASELTCYYYGFLLGYGLLWGRRALPGIAATALSAATCWFSLIAWNDEHFGLMSLASSLVVVVVTAHVAFGAAPSAKAARTPG